jgi:hypothetical protein
MAVYIELEEDPFLGAFDDEISDAKEMDLRVRRPMRGIQLRRDQPAYITIIDRYGNNIPLVDAGGDADELGKGRSVRYTNFLVTGYSAPRREKQQLIQTFGDDYLFLYGEQPKVYSIQGKLLHTSDFNWRNEFLYNYENYLRGTKLAQAGARAYISQSGLLWAGYPIGFSHQETSAQPNHVNFTMEFLVTDETIVDNVGDVTFPTPSTMQILGTGSMDNPWANNMLAAALQVTGALLSPRAAFEVDLADFLSSGGERIQSFKRETPLRGKISDNLDEYLGGKLRPEFDQMMLAKARKKMGVRRIQLLIKEQYLRAKFVMDSARRLTVGEQTTLTKVFGATFIVTSLLQAALPD